VRIFYFLGLLPLLGVCQNNGHKIYNLGYQFSFDGYTTEYAEVGWAPGCDGDNETPAISHDGSTMGVYSISTDGEQASWEHVELELVDGSGLNRCAIDLSKEVLQKIQVTFFATHDAEVMIVLSDGVSEHPTANWELAADNVPALLMDYEESMGEVTITNNTDSYDGNDSIQGNFGFGVFQSDSVLQGVTMINIDSSQISELWVYYRKKDVEPNCTGLNEQVAGTLTLKEICLGRCSVSEVKKGEAPFDAYPNPSVGIVYFSDEQMEVSLVNLAGQVLAEYEDVNSIDLSSLSPGIYILDTYYGYKRIVRN
jgi:hypothetical protein